MARFLKQSTAVDVKIGPFVDSTDGVTAETALTLSQADIRLAKNAGNWAQKNESTSAAHEENGWYECALDATDTNTLGSLMLAVAESGALPVWHEFIVLAANVYDSIVGATDKLDVNVEEWKGSTAPAMTGDAFARLGAPAGASVSADVASVKVDTGTTIPGRIPAALVGGRMDSNVGAVSGSSTAADNLEDGALGIVRGAAATGTLSTTQMTTNLSEATDDHYNGRTIVWITGPLAGQAREVLDYTGTGGKLTFAATTDAPANGNQFIIV